MSSQLINRFDQADEQFDNQLASLLAWESVSDSAVQDAVSNIVSAVRERGDQALLEYTQRFDGLAAQSAVNYAARLRRKRQHIWWYWISRNLRSTACFRS